MKLRPGELLSLGIFFIVVFFLLNRGCGKEEYHSGNVGVSVSSRTVAVLNGNNLDLSSELDPSLLPDIVKEAYLKGADLKKEGKDLIKFVMGEISSEISSISTIDLNRDKIPDPILIVPEGDDEQMTFSVRIPDPDQVKTYPNDPDSWQDIADNKSIEVLSVTVFPKVGSNKEASFDVEARPNEYLYEGRGQSRYHSSFSHNYLAYHMMSSMFFRPYGWYGHGFYGGMGGYYGMGYYGGMYGGRSVGGVRQSRTTTRYKKSSASNTSRKTASGKSVKSSKSSASKPSSVSKYKSSALKNRAATRARKASGFGGSKGRASSSSRSSSGWGRSSGRSSRSWGGSRGSGK